MRMISLLALLRLIDFELSNYELDRVEDILIDLCVTVIFQNSVFMFGYSLADQALNSLLRHTKCLVEFLVVAFFIV